MVDSCGVVESYVVDVWVVGVQKWASVSSEKTASANIIENNFYG